jgi:hypothetical protein
MEDVFKGELMRECRLARELHYPLPPTVFDNYEAGEDGGVEVLTKWTNTILNQALNAVVTNLNPVGRVAGSLCDLKVKGRRGTPCRPDGGSVTPSDLGHSKRATLRIPSDVKPPSSWNSLDFIAQTLEANGSVRHKLIMRPIGAPIRQIYTYCMKFKARYGFLLTTKEVFLVRIRPQSTNTEAEQGQDWLEQALKNDGLMKYKSIPWTEHRNLEAASEYRQLTMNLSLWCMHVLAGNNHEVKWMYEPLHAEKKSARDELALLRSFASKSHSFVAVTQSFGASTVTDVDGVKTYCSFPGVQLIRYRW